jgi:hypothetical protein
MATAKSIQQPPQHADLTNFQKKSVELTSPRIDPERLEKARICAEAQRRATFVREMGGSVSGYCDGYTDGFEHAIQWLLGQLSDPLTVEYRPSAGMNFAKDRYRHDRKERKKLIEWFEKIETTVKSPK